MASDPNSSIASDPNSSMAKESKLMLKSSDGKIFEVDHAVAVQSQIVKNVMETAVPLDNISSNILAKVIEYCEYHVIASKLSEGKSAISEEDVKTWEQEFVKVDLATLFDLIMAAKYMDINNLLDLTCKAVADRIKENSPQEIRKIFNIENDFTPEEEEEIRRKNQWAYK